MLSWLCALLSCRLAAADSLGVSGAYLSWSLKARADTDASYQMLILSDCSVVYVALLLSVFGTGQLEPHVYQP